MGMPIFGRYYQEKFVDRENLIVVSPDLGSVARGRALAEKLKVKLAIVDKRREDEVTEVLNIIGKVKGKRAILIDDEIGTAGSITSAAQALSENGALEVYACCTHGKFAGEAIEKIQKSPIIELVSLDTIQLAQEKKIDKIHVLSVDEVFARAIFRIHEGMSVSDLFV
jgi:ribose-phosphate pyrophosphokinase